MDLFGLVDAQNVPVEVVHYVSPALVIVYFICASSVPSHSGNSADPSDDATASGAEPEDSLTTTATTTGIRRVQPRSSSNLLKWLFVLAVLTFVSFPWLRSGGVLMCYI